jgi:hypothetical protein
LHRFGYWSYCRGDRSGQQEQAVGLFPDVVIDAWDLSADICVGTYSCAGIWIGSEARPGEWLVRIKLCAFPSHDFAGSNARAFLGPALAGLISGSFVVEKVFNVPGLGQEFIKSVFNRDYPLILGTVAFFGILIVVFNLLSDIIQTLLDPKSRK